jgi:alkanesulfonate monooxygenase
VAAAFLDCHALGVTTFLIRGFDPLDDAVEDGRELLSAIRARVAEWLVGAMAAESPSAPNLV